MLNQQQSVASAVLDHSECAEVFQRHRIDFCCRGDVTIGAAATASGVAVDALLEELTQAVAERGGQPEGDLRELATPELVAHIVSKHHQSDRGAVAEQLQSMLSEHHSVAKLLTHVRAASDEFSVPVWGCNSYRTLFSELEQLERDVFGHVHLEITS